MFLNFTSTTAKAQGTKATTVCVRGYFYIWVKAQLSAKDRSSLTSVMALLGPVTSYPKALLPQEDTQGKESVKHCEKVQTLLILTNE